MRVELLVIDPQTDFCDPDKGSLYVKGAENDMTRLAKLIESKGNKFKEIHVTLDCHNSVDVAHPCFWVDSKGANPNPFTIITADDVKNGKWIPVFPQYRERMVQYVKGLETGCRYPLCIWPPHCLIGSIGNTVYPPLYEALLKWESVRPWNVRYVSKGSNPFTEHYSAVTAEIPDPADASTQLNVDFINTLMKADIVAIAGEAGSHCLANTVTDIANNFGDDSAIGKLVLLEDATSPVTGFEQFQVDFIKVMTARGMKISNTVDFLA